MAMPKCANKAGECRTISVSELFHRAVEISHQIHALSTETYSEFIQHFIQGQHLNFSTINSCHTSSIVTPQNKEDALRTPHERLLSLTTVILHSWRDPLQYVISEFSATHGITNSLLSKSVKIVKQVKQLAKGLNKITEQIGQLGGAIEQTVPWEHHLAEDGDSIMLQLYNLLHCFRRDTNKIDTYLKLLKCRFTQQSKC